MTLLGEAVVFHPWHALAFVGCVLLLDVLDRINRWFESADRDRLRFIALDSAMRRGDVAALKEGAILAERVATHVEAVNRIWVRARIPFSRRMVAEAEQWSQGWMRMSRDRAALHHRLTGRSARVHRGRSRAVRSSHTRLRGSRRSGGRPANRAGPPGDSDGPSSSDPPLHRAREARP